MINVYKMFSRRDFSWKHPIQNIRNSLSIIRWKNERAKNGYCSYDIGDIDFWFVELMPRMLRDLKRDTMGYPCDEDLYLECYEAHKDELEGVNQEEFMSMVPLIDQGEKYHEWCSGRWKEILEEMAVAFENVQKAWDDGDYENLENIKDRAIEMFRKHFFSLWH